MAGKYEGEAEVLEALLLACYRAGGQKKWAAENGFHNVVVSGTLRKTRSVGDRIAAAVGYRKAWVRDEQRSDGANQQGQPPHVAG